MKLKIKKMRTEYNDNQGVIVNDRQELNVLCNFLDEQGYSWADCDNFKLSSLDISKGHFFEGYPLAVFPSDGRWIPNVFAEGSDDFLYIQALDAVGINPMKVGDVVEGRSFAYGEWKEYTYLGFDAEKTKPFRVLKTVEGSAVGEKIVTTVYLNQVRPAINHQTVVSEKNITNSKFQSLINLYKSLPEVQENIIKDRPTKDAVINGKHTTIDASIPYGQSNQELIANVKQYKKRKATQEYLQTLEAIENEYKEDDRT